MEHQRVQIEKSNQPTFYACTAMCKHVVAGHECPLKAEGKCTYAHSESELQMPLCKYGKKCTFAYRNGSAIERPICKFRHPELNYNPPFVAQTHTVKKSVPAHTLEKFVTKVIPVPPKQDFPPLQSQNETKIVNQAAALWQTFTLKKPAMPYQPVPMGKIGSWADECDDTIEVKKVVHTTPLTEMERKELDTALQAELEFQQQGEEWLLQLTEDMERAYADPVFDGDFDQLCHWFIPAEKYVRVMVCPSESEIGTVADELSATEVGITQIFVTPFGLQFMIGASKKDDLVERMKARGYGVCVEV